MAETLMHKQMLTFGCGMALVATMSLACARAETLSDPTRPAIATAQSVPVEGVTTAQVGVGMVVTAKEGVVALMDGRLLRVGSRTEGGVVVRIAPDAVFVRSVEGKVARLPLYPEVDLQPVTGKTGSKRGDGSPKRHHEWSKKP